MGRKLKMDKHGLAEDPRGLHVTYEEPGRIWIGEVIHSRYKQTGAIGMVLTVRSFNGDLWPWEPFARSVTVLERKKGRKQQ